MTPRWVIVAALLAVLFAVGCFVLGPVLIYSIAAASVDAELDPAKLANEAARNEFLEGKIKELFDRFAWIFPVGGGLGFLGATALMLAWVSRPLGSDLDAGPRNPVG